jgi:hypothetical protein
LADGVTVSLVLAFLVLLCAVAVAAASRPASDALRFAEGRLVVGVSSTSIMSESPPYSTAIGSVARPGDGVGTGEGEGVATGAAITGEGDTGVAGVDGVTAPMGAFGVLGDGAVAAAFTVAGVLGAAFVGTAAGVFGVDAVATGVAALGVDGLAGCEGAFGAAAAATTGG